MYSNGLNSFTYTPNKYSVNMCKIPFHSSSSLYSHAHTFAMSKQSSSVMPKSILRTKSISKKLCIAALIGSVLFFLALLWFNTKEPSFSSHLLLLGKTFYDDPETHYTIDKPMSNWDEKRSVWLKNHPNLASKNGVMVVTGSQPSPCKNPVGDLLLLRLFKNKVDYCRTHRHKIFYNNALLEPSMKSFWAKIPILRAAMIAHPETEWLFWVDSDAVFTDMDFELPLERYKDHNMVVHGWPDMIYKEKSWVAVNAGVFLIRNCQWTMDFLDVWSGMGPISPDYAKWGRVQRETLKDKMFPESDDQSAIVYLLLRGGSKWKDKIYVENEYMLHGYWLGLADKFDDIAEKYLERERSVKKLRRRHAEVVPNSRECYDDFDWGMKRPFVTHFTGCQPCSGDHNPAYEGDSCWVGMEKALNFADNQVLRNYGFVRPDLGNNTSLVRTLPFDYPRNYNGSIDKL